MHPHVCDTLSPGNRIVCKLSPTPKVREPWPILAEENDSFWTADILMHIMQQQFRILSCYKQKRITWGDRCGTCAVRWCGPDLYCAFCIVNLARRPSCRGCRVGGIYMIRKNFKFYIKLIPSALPSCPVVTTREQRYP